jgi:hypothetical protein
MTDLSAQAALRNMVNTIGQMVTFQRVVGVAPNVTILPAPNGATLMARVRGYTPESTEVAETGYASSQVGAITQTDRKVIVVADDLAATGFPMPVKKNDKIILVDGTKGNVTEVDAHKRSFSGGIEITMAEIA